MHTLPSDSTVCVDDLSTKKHIAQRTVRMPHRRRELHHRWPQRILMRECERRLEETALAARGVAAHVSTTLNILWRVWRAVNTDVPAVDVIFLGTSTEVARMLGAFLEICTNHVTAPQAHERTPLYSLRRMIALCCGAGADITAFG